MRRRNYIVTVMQPNDVSDHEMIEYIDDAVHTHRGAYEPPNEDNDYQGHPLHSQNVEQLVIAVRSTKVALRHE